MANSLFYQSAVLACRELKSRPSFWLLLYAKIFIAALVTFFLLVLGFAGGCAGIFKLFSFHISGASESVIQEFAVQIMSMASRGAMGIAFCVTLLVFFGIFWVTFFYLLLNFYVLFFANTLDAARHKHPRGLVRIQRVTHFFPFFILIFALNLKCDFGSYALSSVCMLTLFFIKYYVFYSRIVFSLGFMLEGVSLVQAVKQSWKTTANKGVQMCAFGAFYVASDGLAKLAAMAVATSFAWVVAILSLLVFSVAGLFYGLLFGYAYVSLEKEHKN